MIRLISGVIRYADVKLMYAEVTFLLNEDVDSWAGAVK